MSNPKTINYLHCWSVNRIVNWFCFPLEDSIWTMQFVIWSLRDFQCYFNKINTKKHIRNHLRFHTLVEYGLYMFFKSNANTLSKNPKTHLLLWMRVVHNASQNTIYIQLRKGHKNPLSRSGHKIKVCRLDKPKINEYYCNKPKMYFGTFS